MRRLYEVRGAGGEGGSPRSPLGLLSILSIEVTVSVSFADQVRWHCCTFADTQLEPHVGISRPTRNWIGVRARLPKKELGTE
jgi:hypothetical protein